MCKLLRASCRTSSGGSSFGEDGCQSEQFQKMSNPEGSVELVSLCSFGSINFFVVFFVLCLSTSEGGFDGGASPGDGGASDSTRSAEAVVEVVAVRLLAGVLSECRN